MRPQVRGASGYVTGLVRPIANGVQYPTGLVPIRLPAPSKGSQRR